jgi:lipid-binding SYLF domain-containing protein
VAIIPQVVKAGFVVAGSGGHGLVIAQDKAGRWGDPVFVNFGGGSVGLQAGVESAAVVLVFRGRTRLDRLLVG